MRWGKRLLCLIALLCCLCAGAQAAMVRTNAQQDGRFGAVLPTTKGTVQVTSVFLSEETVEAHWLFLPTFADGHAVPITSIQSAWRWANGKAFESGQPVDVLAEFDEIEPGVYASTLKNDEEVLQLNVMFSQNLRTLFFESDDPVNEGRAWVEGSERHQNRTTGHMALIDQNGEIDHAASVKQWRGRGNSTWAYAKKPYQFKLGTKADLLQTGQKDEKNRTWVLLADAVDETFLRDRIAFDLGLTLGMTETSRSEYVDLYYDGVYAGLYLLCEKVEIAPGRVAETDYDKLMERWNAAAGRRDLSSLPEGADVNAYGLPFTYTNGAVGADDPSAGAYLLELEAPQTLSDPCYFSLGNGQTIALKNPEYATADMVRFVSEKLETARRALENHGIDPQSGISAEALLDIDAFARIAAINEWGGNMDGFSHSSSFFILPSGAQRFRPGPVWDFSLSWCGITEAPGSGDNEGFKDNGWLPLFYRVPAIRAAVRNVFVDELYPWVTNTLLDSENGLLNRYAAHIAPAKHMSRRYWSVAGYESKGDWMQQVAQLAHDIARRTQWLYERISRWNIETADTVELYAQATYLLLEDTLNVRVTDWSNAELVSYEAQQLTEATEEAFALWQLNAEIAPINGIPFTDRTCVLFNDVPVAHTLTQEGHLLLNVLFEDPSYRPFYLYGEDIGMIFDPDYYAANEPDIAQICEGDPECMAEYFCDEGMPLAQQGNAFFTPRLAQKTVPELEDYLGRDWPQYYYEFIYGAYEEWMPAMNKRFYLTAMDADAASSFEEGVQ